MPLATVIPAFEALGASGYPWYGNPVFPHAVYEPSLNQIWMTWQGWQGSPDNTRCVYLRVFDVATMLWGPAILVNVGSFLISADSHGNPAICRTPDGYWYIFFGSHETSQIVAELLQNPDDPTSWFTAGSQTISGTYTYPHPNVVGGLIYLFLRDGGSFVNEQILCLRVGTPSGTGTATWAAQVNVARLGANSRFYNANNWIRGTTILICGCRSDGVDTYRDNVYFLAYDTVTGNVSNIDNSHTTLAASLPVTAADMESFYKIVDQTPATTLPFWTPAFCVDTNGNYHFLYWGLSGGVPGALYYVGYFGAGITAAVKLDDGLVNSPEPSISALANGKVQAFWSRTTGAILGPADIYTAVRSAGSGGSWSGAERLMRQPGIWGLYASTAIVGEIAGANGSVLFTEVNGEEDPTQADGSTRLQGFMYYQGQFYGASIPYVGFGDLLGGSVGYWGLRAFKYSAIGSNCVKLRRDSDNATQSFVTIAGGRLDIASIVAFKGSANLFVDTLYDQSGTGNHMTQATLGSQPAFVFNGLNGLPVMQFSGSQKLSASIGTYPQSFIMSAVVERTGSFTSFQGILTSNTGFLYFDNVASQVSLYGGGGGHLPTSAADNAWHAIVALAEGAGSIMAIDGSTNASGTGANSATSDLTIGGDGLNENLVGFLVEAGIALNSMALNSELPQVLNLNQRAYWGF